MKGAIQKINNNLLKLLDEFGKFFWNREIKVWPGKYVYREHYMTRKLTHINVLTIMKNKENEFNLCRLKRFRNSYIQPTASSLFFARKSVKERDKIMRVCE